MNLFRKLPGTVFTDCMTDMKVQGLKARQNKIEKAAGPAPSTDHQQPIFNYRDGLIHVF